LSLAVLTKSLRASLIALSSMRNANAASKKSCQILD
jgi:hypothetical protein